MELKTCSKCKEEKGVSEFHKDRSTPSGLQYPCKDCQRDAKRDYCKTPIGKAQKASHDSKYKASPRGKSASERSREKRKHTAVGRASRKRCSDRYRLLHPEKKLAHQAVARALSRGDIVRKPCEVCGSTTRIEAHHDDYSKRLDVRWLCKKHHVEVHHCA